MMKTEQDPIAALKKALAEAHLVLQVYDELITQANTRSKGISDEGAGSMLSKI